MGGEGGGGCIGAVMRTYICPLSSSFNAWAACTCILCWMQMQTTKSLRLCRKAACRVGQGGCHAAIYLPVV